MLIVLFAIGLVTLILGIYLYENTSMDDSAIAIGVIGGLLAFISLIALLVMAVFVSKDAVLPEELAIYEEENARIEDNISAIVNNYMAYEQQTFSSVTAGSTDVSVLVQLYPDLKSDVLVQSQIEVYATNNEKIKEIKASLVHASVHRWWLYFGH